MLNVLFILKALKHNNIMPELLPGWTRKDIEKLPNFFFSAKDRNAKIKTCYISEERSGIITSSQDFYLGEAETI